MIQLKSSSLVEPVDFVVDGDADSDFVNSIKIMDFCQHFAYSDCCGVAIGEEQTHQWPIAHWVEQQRHQLARSG